MPGSNIGSTTSVSRQDLIKQSVEALAAGGTVYIGENHTEDDARSICCDILKKRCVQFLCLEFDTSCSDILSPDNVDMVEGSIGHKPSFKMSKVMNACTSANGKCTFVDKPDGTTMSQRQKHIAKEVNKYRNQISQPGRGVLVLIGSDHLKDINESGGQWKALQNLVYDGLSFIHGRYKTCAMVWHLS